MAGSERSDTYWATLPNTECVKELVKRRLAFADKLTSTGIIHKISRSWDYYHGQYFTSTAGGTMAIQKSDDEDESALANVNFTRAIVDQHVTFVLSDRPAWDTRAINSSGRAREKAILFNEVLDATMDTGSIGLEEKLRKFSTYAAVLAGGFMYTSWDMLKGPDVRPDEEGAMLTSGDIRYEPMSLIDVAWDLAYPDFDEIPWIQIRTIRNRWELMDLYPACEENIRNAKPASEVAGDYAQIGDIGFAQDLTDTIIVWEFMHKRTRAVKEGRHIAYIDDQYPLFLGGEEESEPYPYKNLHVTRLVPSEYLMTCLGYSFAFDMQVPQEIYGAALSALLTSFNVLGMPRIYLDENSNARVEDLEGFGNVPVIRGSNGMEPKELKFDIRLKENAETMQIAKGEMGEMAGVGPTSRGVADPNLKDAPAAALAILDSKASQSTSIFEKRYRAALGKIGTDTLEVYKVHAAEPRLTALVGRKNRGRLLRWSQEDLNELEIVVVERGSPMQRSLEGKVRLADALAQHGWVTTKEEYLTVVETGQVESMVDTLESQLATIADENDILREKSDTADALIEALAYAKVGGDLALQEDIKKYLQQVGVVCLNTDNHLLHAKKHLTLIDSTEARGTRGLVLPVGTHAAEHLLKLQDPMILQQQIALGYLLPDQLQQFMASMQIPGVLGPVPPQANPQAAPPGGVAKGLETSKSGPTSPPPVSQTGRPPEAGRVPNNISKETVATARA